MTATLYGLNRHHDVSGVSGTGVVAEGWESSNGEWVCVVWLSEIPSMETFRDIRDIERVHGHNGKSQIVFDTPTQYTPTATSKYEHDPIHDPRD